MGKIDFNDTRIAFQARTGLELRRAQMLFRSFGSPLLVQTGTKLVTSLMRFNVPVTAVIKATVFNHFCGGETIADCDKTINALARHRVGAILDFAVEALGHEDDLDRTVDEVMRLIANAGADTRVPFVAIKVTSLARFALLEKLHAQQALTAAEEAERARAESRITKIAAAAAEKNVRLLIDAEETWIQDPIDAWAELMMTRHNTGRRTIIFNTLQMYRVDRLAFLKDRLRAAAASGYRYGLKLVRGAYMEKERKRALAMGYASPIQPDKAHSDKAFDDALAAAVADLEHAAIFCGSHNELSTRLLIDLMERHRIPAGDPRISFSQLLGMSDNLTYNLAHHGYNASKYVPYGPVRSVLPYLFRRAQENTSIKGQAGRELQLIERELERRDGVQPPQLVPAP